MPVFHGALHGGMESEEILIPDIECHIKGVDMKRNLEICRHCNQFLQSEDGKKFACKKQLHYIEPFGKGEKSGDEENGKQEEETCQVQQDQCDS